MGVCRIEGDSTVVVVLSKDEVFWGMGRGGCMVGLVLEYNLVNLMMCGA